VLKISSPKNENCHHLFIIMSVQICVNFFLLYNINGEKSVVFFLHTYRSQWMPSTVWLPTFFKISFCVRRKLMQVWNNLRVRN